MDIIDRWQGTCDSVIAFYDTDIDRLKKHRPRDKYRRRCFSVRFCFVNPAIIASVGYVQAVYPTFHTRKYDCTLLRYSLRRPVRVIAKRGKQPHHGKVLREELRGRLGEVEKYKLTF